MNSGPGSRSSRRIEFAARSNPELHNPAIGSIFAITSLPLKNLWMLVFWSLISPGKPGPRTLEWRTYQFGQLWMLLRKVVRSTLTIKQTMPALRNPGSPNGAGEY
jgi:hypothetical protein